MAQTPWNQVDPWLKRTAERNAREDAQKVLEYYKLDGQIELALEDEDDE